MLGGLSVGGKWREIRFPPWEHHPLSVPPEEIMKISLDTQQTYMVYRKRMKATYLSLATFGAMLTAQAGAAESVQMQAEHVALFKNGYSQVSLTGELPNDKELELRGIPVPVEGSLWWQLPQGVRAVQVEGSIREREVPAERYSTAELLAANVGKQVRLVLEDGVTYEGELTRRPLPKPAALTYPNHGGSVEQQQLSQQAPVFLKNAKGELLEIKLSSVLSVAFAESPAVPMGKEMQPLLTMQLREPAAGGKLRVECLAGGLSWHPTYHLDLSDETKPELTCMAIITNDMVDLNRVQLELVTGNPELGSDGMPISPLTRLNHMARKGTESTATPCGAPAWMAESEDDDEDDESAAFMSVARTQELYHYAIPDFSARKNSTVAREIFVQAPGCSHLYTCEIGPRHDSDDEIDVWHCVCLTNKAAWPWSSGTLVCYSGGKLLARTELKDTAPGQKTRLRLATTQEVKATVNETQVSCRPLALASLAAAQKEVENLNAAEAADEDDIPADADKTITTYRGEITLKNAADHPVDIELKKTLIAYTTAVESPEMAHISNVGTSGDNHRTRIKWRLTLAPGESKVIRYSYATVSSRKPTP